MEIPFNNAFMLNSAKTENAIDKIENNAKPDKDIQKAAQDFEAVLLNMVIKSMWKTVPKSDLFEKNSANNIYEGLMHSSLAEEMASNGGMGIATALAKQLSKEQKNL